jgi:CAI-1 autoinducer synthase
MDSRPPLVHPDGSLDIDDPSVEVCPDPGSTKYPQWLTAHLQDHRRFIDSLDPFPFDQPSDIRGYFSLHQNDYLRLANHPDVVRARREANQRPRIESFSSSIFGGASDEHNAFVALLCESMQAEGVILTTAGWTANVGLIEAVAPPDRPIYIDAEAHASMSDGIRLSRGRRVVVKHNDPDHLEKRVRIHGPGLICIDALYSTDGVLPDLRRYVEICERYECTLILDEAHSFGMFGAKGGGLAVEQGLAERVHFRTVSLSKALGGHGGLIACSRDMLRSLCTCVRPVLFSSATSAVLAAGHAKALEIVMHEPQRARHCLAMAALLRSRLHEHGITTAGSASQIVSIFFQNEDACRFYQAMREHRILTSVFVFPAIPRGVSLARFSVYADLTEADIHFIADRTIDALADLGLPGGGP